MKIIASKTNKIIILIAFITLCSFIVKSLEIEMEKYPIENMTVNNNTWIGYCSDFTSPDNYTCIANGKVWTRGNNLSGFYVCVDSDANGCIII